MMTNVGTMDRVLRAGLGILLLWIAFGSGLAAMDGAALKYGAAIVGVIMLATSLFKFCPLYRIIGIRTCKAS